MSYIEQHIEDHCKTADDVRINALRVISKRMALRPVQKQQIPIKAVEPSPAPIPVVIIEPPSFIDPPPYQISIKHIQRTVCRVFDISIEQLLCADRRKELIIPRHVSFVLCRILTVRSYPEIGRRSNRDHSSIVHAFNKMRWLADALKRELKPTDPLSTWVVRANELINERSH